MKKFLSLSTALIGATLFSGTVYAQDMQKNKVDVFLNGDVQANIAFVHNDAHAYDTITGEKVKWQDVKLDDATYSGFKDLNNDIWTEAYVGVIADIKVDHEIIKEVTGHLGLIDGADTFLHDHTVDTYVKLKTKYGDLTVGDRNFTDEMMITGGADFESDEDEYIITDAAGSSLASTSDHNYMANTQWYSAESDLDLADGSEARIQYKSPTIQGFNVGGYMALSGDDGAITASDNDGPAYIQEDTKDRSTRKDYSYGVGVSYMYDFSNHILLDANALYQNHGKTNAVIVSGKVIIPMEDNANIMQNIGTHHLDPINIRYDRSLWLKAGYTVAYSTYENDMTLSKYYVYGDPDHKANKGANHNMYGSVGMDWDHFDMGFGIFGGLNRVQSAVGFGGEVGMTITHGVHWTMVQANMEHRKTQAKASTIAHEETQTAYAVSSQLKISF